MLFLSNEGFTFTETRLCVQLHAGTLLRQDVVFETDAVAVGKCCPDQPLSECPTEDGSRCSTATLSSSLHKFALVRYSRLLLVQLLTYITCLLTTNTIVNKTLVFKVARRWVCCYLWALARSFYTSCLSTKMTRFNCLVLESLFKCVEQVFPDFDWEAAVS
jgi:hypothetical protein